MILIGFSTGGDEGARYIGRAHFRGLTDRHKDRLKRGLIASCKSQAD